MQPCISAACPVTCKSTVCCAAVTAFLRCPNGKSTFFEGSTSLADCMAYAAGYGKVGSAAALCYTGTYNDGSSEVCLPCPLGTTTDVTGATSNANTLSGNPVDTFCKREWHVISALTQLCRCCLKYLIARPSSGLPAAHFAAAGCLLVHLLLVV